ncbi:RpiB/LacA/LacB family sugar-phosphate isomerase [Lentisphaera marina]|uniref:RpiB/LacA/LacB family sugar-phosphate isomerase n=1 Tax=Lentisphaera marina TaxID=1111041 RepID=UPI002366BEAD|nr:RpiB/LacA/LacB family sugar-phosphate isomerase [Lentisphaera marina]MDD7984453.1 RpiB/LacA/LacB family sugar-phosphate isomerase [Lentisphaera marina]
MKISIASDHAGFEFNNKLKQYLESKGHVVTSFGCSGLDSCDYPDFGIPAAKSVSEGEVDRAILVCNNGIGMSMLANKLNGVLAALVYSEETARMTRQHHGSNVLCLGAAQFSEEELMTFIKTWMETEFEGGRHDRRIGKVRDLDS